jgi:hypothetical protein
MSLNRVASGFPLADIGVTPWPEYRGYETPVDVMKFRSSRSVFEPKLVRSERYIADIKRMVTMCQEKEGVYIPPTWLSREQATELGRRMGLRVDGPGGDNSAQNS